MPAKQSPHTRVAEPSPTAQHLAWGQLRTHRSNPTSDGSLCSCAPYPQKESKVDQWEAKKRAVSSDTPLGQGWETEHTYTAGRVAQPMFQRAVLLSAGQGYELLIWIATQSTGVGSSAIPRGHYCFGRA